MHLNIFLLLIIFLAIPSCEKEDLTYSSGDLRIEIKTGKNWLHEFPGFMGLKKNAPQFAIWIEDSSGNYLSTIFVTRKAGTEGWIMNKGNRRKESLPHWCYKRGITYDDGLLLPTKESPITDGITGPTPKSDKEFLLRLKDTNQPIIVKAEFNHSVDFNEYFPESAKESDENYSGGKEGSGQPAVVYADTIYHTTQSALLKLIGHSSPDGTDGNLYLTLEKLSTAKEIVDEIIVELTK
jgi:hypothetical protein